MSDQPAAALEENSTTAAPPAPEQIEQWIETLNSPWCELNPDAIAALRDNWEPAFPRLLEKSLEAIASARENRDFDLNLTYISLLLFADVAWEPGAELVREICKLSDDQAHNVLGEDFYLELTWAQVKLCGDPEFLFGLVGDSSRAPAPRECALEACLRLFAAGQIPRETLIAEFFAAFQTVVNEHDCSEILVEGLHYWAMQLASNEERDAFDPQGSWRKELSRVASGWIYGDPEDSPLSGRLQDAMRKYAPAPWEDVLRFLDDRDAFCPSPRTQYDSFDDGFSDAEREILGGLAQGDYDWRPDELSDPMQVFRSQPRIGRNDPCYCGSGKKHKKCCGRND